MMLRLVTGLMVVMALGAAEMERSEDVVYGRKHGLALTMDVFRPAQANGYGVVLMVSATWRSKKEDIRPEWYGKLLGKGYTVFTVLHGSQPKFLLEEIVADSRAAVAFIQQNAGRWGVDGKRLGLTGFSAGCHLALMNIESAGATACFFPPTDFLNWGGAGQMAFGGPESPVVKTIMGPKADAGMMEKLSPIGLVSPKVGPVLLVHGDKDPLVPLYQSQRYVEKVKEAGVKTELIVMPGKPHGWPGIQNDLELVANWFDANLKR
jgi:acetyl esterase/lipase